MVVSIFSMSVPVSLALLLNHFASVVNLIVAAMAQRGAIKNDARQQAALRSDSPARNAQCRWMTFVGACLASHLTIAGAAAGDGPVGQSGNWQRIFTDEFDGKELDGEKWVTCYWWDDNGCTNLGTNEIEWYLPGNTSLANGILQLTARPETVIGFEGRTFSYTSGIVTTGRYYRESSRPARFAMHHGYVEIRAKIPAGQGLWPAFWMLPTDHNSRPEIDVMEALGHRLGVLEMHYHYLDAEGERQSAGHETEHLDLSDDWHVFGLDWHKDALIWYLDGVRAMAIHGVIRDPR